MGEHLSLERVFIEHGTLIELPLNYRLLLHDEESVLWIEEGEIDLFALEPLRQQLEILKSKFSEIAKEHQPFLGDKIQGGLHFLRNIHQHSLLLSFASQFKVGKPIVTLVANQLTKLRKLSVSFLCSVLEKHPEWQPQVDKHIHEWVSHLAPIFLYRPTPKYLIPLEIGKERKFTADTSIAPVQAEFEEEKIVWMQIQQGAIEICGMQTLTLKQGAYFYPLAHSTWFQTTEESCLSALCIHPILSNSLCKEGLLLFHSHVIDALFFNKLTKGKIELNKIKQQSHLDAVAFRESLNHLSNLFSQEDRQFPLIGTNHIYLACQLIGNTLNLKFTPLPDEHTRKFSTVGDYVYALCLHSHIHSRQVTLIDNWWEHELGPLLCFHSEEQYPIALLPNPKGGYHFILPESPEKGVFDPTLFPYLQPTAYLFYRSFPDKEKLTGREVGKFAAKNKGKDLVLFLFFGFLATLVAACIPFISRQLFAVAIPNLDYVILAQSGMALLLIAVTAMVFSLSREYLNLRLQTLVDMEVSSALWQRVLKLPTHFFRKFNVGDLFNRIQIMPQMRRIFSGPMLRELLVGIFSCVYLVPMFYFNSKLAWIGLGVIACGVTILGIAATYLYSLSKERLVTVGALYGKIFQTLMGINAIRTYGCENRFFSNWEKLFSKNKRLEWKMTKWQNLISVVNTMISPISLLFIYATMMIIIKTKMEAGPEASGSEEADAFRVGDFMGFYFAFTAFTAAIISCFNQIIQLLNIFPIWEQSKVYLESSLESTDRSQPGELKGEIKVDHLFFRYASDASLILKDVSIHANPGEFIGIVGHSGCGKSTLMRLLIGFETAESGAIYFDGRDLATLDLQEVRKQMGIVLQNSAILDGTIRDNVMTGGMYKDEQIMQALSLAGFTKDLASMPMGLDTVLMNGGGTLSGGQRQRILIARALVGNPKILIFDEATSALDNQTQELISQNLERMNMTRIAIAHRLSTIRNANCIYVMHQGKVMDFGTFKELASRKGIFYDLLMRQKESRQFQNLSSHLK